MTVTSRYDTRKELDGTWTVYDRFTKMTAELRGVPLRLLTVEEADDALDLLEMEENTGPTAP